MCRRNKILVWVLMCTLSPLALAEKGDRDKPLEVRADHNKIDGKTDKSILSGNVIVVQGTMEIRADNLSLSQDAQDNQFAQGSGKPVRFKQKLDQSEDWLEAEALRFDYDGKKGILQLFDKVILRKGRDIAYASKVVYDLNTEVYELFGEPGKQHHLIMLPKNKQTTDRKPAQ